MNVHAVKLVFPGIEDTADEFTVGEETKVPNSKKHGEVKRIEVNDPQDKVIFARIAFKDGFTMTYAGIPYVAGM